MVQRKSSKKCTEDLGMNSFSLRVMVRLFFLEIMWEKDQTLHF